LFPQYQSLGVGQDQFWTGGVISKWVKREFMAASSAVVTAGSLSKSAMAAISAGVVGVVKAANVTSSS
jgi:hypothetical protein